MHAQRTPHPRLLVAAREVIAAADNTYTTRWRNWPQTGAALGARRLSEALAELEQSIAEHGAEDAPKPQPNFFARLRGNR